MFFYSLFFGIISWAFAVFAIKDKDKSMNFVILSFLCSYIVVILEFIEILNRLKVGDIGGISDTIGAVIFGIVIMAGVNLILNFIALMKNK